MSADLLAAFGNQSIDDSGGQSNHVDAGHDKTASNKSTLPVVGDTWQSWPNQQASNHSFDTNARILLGAAADTDNNVLFDAEEFESGGQSDEDEFGDFEDADQAGSRNAVGTNTDTTKVAQKPALNLLDLDDLPTTQSTESDHTITGPGTKHVPAETHQEDHAPSGIETKHDEDEWGVFEDVLQESQPQVASRVSSLPAQSHLSTRNDDLSKITHQNVLTQSSASTKKYANDDFDDWDDFEDGPPEEIHPQQAETEEPIFNGTPAPAEREQRPTNMPPPAVLLSLFPKVFSSLSSAAQHSPTTKPTALQIVSTYRVCARLIAGRSLRWKRDTILAQSMRIGAAGRSGGMKLTSIDKAESQREDQEMEEAIASWLRYAPRLNSLMTKHKLQKPPLSLSSSIVPRTVTGTNILKATQPCALCGLKRDERISGIDAGASDIFDEYWIEYWGHRDCCDFFGRTKGLLRHR